MSFNLSCILREASRQYPEKAAALHANGTLTFRELDELSDRLAAGLQHAGVVPGNSVALQLPNLPEFLVAYFGILKAGAVVVPMNVLLKAPEVEFYLANSGAQVFITFAMFADEALKGAEQATVDKIYVLGSTEFTEFTENVMPFSELTDRSSDPVFEPRSPMDTAVIVYTSGTTGTPKGAELTHFQLYMNSDIPGRIFGVEESDIVIVAVPLFHVFGLSSILNIVVRFGATMVLLPRFDSTVVLQSIMKYRATIFEGVPTMYVDLLSQSDFNDYDVSSLRVAISGGAAIPAEVLEEFERRVGVVILEGYGLSETASAATFNQSAAERKAYSVGKPIWGTEAAIWDKYNQPLPSGSDNVGEIVIRGYNVMKGYHGRPDADADAFTGEWFHTGDLGYVDDEGFFFIVDRKNELIIRGGYNVYPREIEEVLYTHPAIFEAAVLGMADPRLGEEVMAFVSLRSGAIASPSEIIDYVKRRVAAYKYPRRVEIRDILPKGSTGKILKTQLKADLDEPE